MAPLSTQPSNDVLGGGRQSRTLPVRDRVAWAMLTLDLTMHGNANTCFPPQQGYSRVRDAYRLQQPSAKHREEPAATIKSPREIDLFPLTYISRSSPSCHATTGDGSFDRIHHLSICNFVTTPIRSSISSTCFHRSAITISPRICSFFNRTHLQLRRQSHSKLHQQHLLPSYCLTISARICDFFISTYLQLLQHSHSKLRQ